MFTSVDPDVENTAVAILARALRRSEVVISAAAYGQARDRHGVLGELLRVSDETFDRTERRAVALASRMRNNLAPSVREHLTDILTDLIDVRWQRWAEREVFEGRDPYQVWTPDPA